MEEKDDNFIINSEGLYVKYIHFMTEKDCSKFIEYINVIYSINIEYKCCGGLGCCIKKNDEIDIKIIEKNYHLQKVTNIGNCDICYENKNLLNFCNRCKENPFCFECYQKIENHTCPFCRESI